MNKYIAYHIIPEMCLIVEYFSGEVRIEDVKQLKSLIKTDDKFNEKYHVISDIRDAKLIMNHQEILMYADEIKYESTLRNKKRIAFLTDTPEQVVYTTLFQLHTHDLPIQIDIVNGLQAAVNWLGFKSHWFILIDELLGKLKKRIPLFLS